MGAFDGLAGALGNVGYSAQQLAGGVAGGINDGLDAVTGGAYRDSGVRGFLGDTGGRFNDFSGRVGAVFVQGAAGTGKQGRELVQAATLPVLLVGVAVVGLVGAAIYFGSQARPFEGGEYHGTARVAVV